MDLWSFLAQFYYTESLMVVTGLMAFVISIKNYRRHRVLRVFCYLLLFDLTQIGTTYYQYMQPGGRFPWVIMMLATLGFVLFENIVCTRFIYSQLISRKRRLAIVGLPFLLVVQTVVFLKFWNQEQFLMFGEVDCVTLTVPCLLYFYELFLHPSGKSLRNDPSFWVITGLLLLKCGSLPLWLSRGFTIVEAYKASTLNFFLYGVFFMMLIKAFLCVPAEKADAREGRSPAGLGSRGNIEPTK